MIKYLVVFVTLNALKITLYNCFLCNSCTCVSLLYKFLASFLLISAISFFALRFRARLLMIVFYTLQAAYIFAGLAYFIYFRSYLHVFHSIVLLIEGLNAAAAMSIPKDPRLLIILIDLPAFIFLLHICKKTAVRKVQLALYFKLSAALCIAFFLFSECLSYARGQSYFHLLKQEPVSENHIVAKYGTLANNLADIIINKNDVNLISSFKYGTRISRERNSPEKPNFILIQVESMDSNIINHTYQGKYITPFLHTLSKNSIFFPYVLSYHKAGGTSDCEFSVINSIEPLDSFPSMKITNYTYPNSIVRMLADASYSTAAFHGNKGSYFNRDKAFARMGFAEYHDMDKMGLNHQGWGAPDDKVFRYASNLLKTLPQPFFSYIITMTSHGPYTNAGHYYNNSDFDIIKDETVRYYFNSMSYVDRTLEEFVSQIRSHFENTYIFIWGDHTPNIDNSYYKQSSFHMDGKYFEFVPLIIITPDNATYFENKNVASFLDFAPTILQISGIAFNYKTDGHALPDATEKYRKIPYRGMEYDRALLYEKIAFYFSETFGEMKRDL